MTQPVSNASNTQPAAVITVKPLAAVEEVKRLIARKSRKPVPEAFGQFRRCSGMSYSMDFDNKPSDFDREFEFDGLKVRVDLKALMYLQGNDVGLQGRTARGWVPVYQPERQTLLRLRFLL